MNKSKGSSWIKRRKLSTCNQKKSYWKIGFINWRESLPNWGRNWIIEETSLIHSPNSMKSLKLITDIWHKRMSSWQQKWKWMKRRHWGISVSWKIKYKRMLLILRSNYRKLSKMQRKIDRICQDCIEVRRRRFKGNGNIKSWKRIRKSKISHINFRIKSANSTKPMINSITTLTHSITH